MAEKPIQTPLPADLPTNWQTGQIVAPTGAQVGYSQQYGYNYLMEQVNAAQQGINSLNNAFPELYGQGDTVAVADGGTGGNTPAEARANLGVPSNFNFFTNWYFGGGGTKGNFPINQKGGSIYNQAGKCIDMCRLDLNSGGVELTFNANSIRLTQTSISGGTKAQSVNIVAPIDRNVLGKTVTLSCLAKGTGTPQMLLTSSGSSIVSGSIKQGVPSNDLQLLTSTFRLPQSSTLFTVSAFLYADISGGLGYSDYMAVKLELGEVQTLARQDSGGNWILNDPPPNYGLELLKCQRYYQLYSTAAERPAKAVDCRPVMRIDPTQGTVVIDGTTYYYNDASL